jgi:hypothetical protein
MLLCPSMPRVEFLVFGHGILPGVLAADGWVLIHLADFRESESANFQNRNSRARK